MKARRGIEHERAWIVGMRPLLALAAVVALAAGFAAAAVDEPRQAAAQESKRADDLDLADDVLDIPCEDLRALGDEKKRYFLIGPRKNEKAPKGGFALMLVLPGGTGEASMTSFVRRIWRECAPKDWVFAQLVAVKWTPDQHTIWPTRFNRANGAKFTTEEFVAAVLEDVTKKQKLKIDPARTYQLGWSSGGPAEYAIALQERSPVTGSYVAQSVFHKDELRSDLKHAKGRAFFIDHSPDDERCPFRLAELARDELTAAGAKVEFVTYKGGHGWADMPYQRLAKGFAWLDENHGKPSR